MPIITDFGCSVQDYVAHFTRLVFPRPACCPHCRQSGLLIGHGCYIRHALDSSQVYRLYIKRWLCKACHHTVSVLPSFLLRFRHYLLAVIQQVVVARFESNASWHDIARCYAPEELPSRRTINRWCRSFAAHAPVWWAAVQETLAGQDAGAPMLDPLGPAAGPLAAPQALLHAATALLAWAKTRWVELADYGLKDRLRFLWHWGCAHGLERLI